MEKQIAGALLSIGAVFLRPEEPFTWASGIKSPIYCDNRLTLTAPEVRDQVENGLMEVIRREYPDVEVLMGTSTAGIAHAAIVAHMMHLPMGYVRGGNKDHGRQNRIEGKLEKGQKVVVVEDLISTGGSVIDVVEALREAGAEVLGIASIFTYGMQKGLDRLAAAGVKNVSLSNFDVLVQVAAEKGYIRPEQVERLIRFRRWTLNHSHFYQQHISLTPCLHLKMVCLRDTHTIAPRQISTFDTDFTFDDKTINACILLVQMIPDLFTFL